MANIANIVQVLEAQNAKIGQFVKCQNLDHPAGHTAMMTSRKCGTTIAQWDNRLQNFPRPVVGQFSRPMASFSREDLKHKESRKKIEKSVPRG